MKLIFPVFDNWRASVARFHIFLGVYFFILSSTHLILEEEAYEAVYFSFLIVGSFSSACLNLTVPIPDVPLDRKSQTIYVLPRR